MTTGARILYVEDDADVRTVTHHVLQSFGHTVLSCGFPERALVLFEESRPAIDLLVTDVEMPGFSGIVLAQELTRRRPGLPVLIVSGAHLSAADQDCLAKHRWKFLSKPVSLNDLEAAIYNQVQHGPSLEQFSEAPGVPACL